MKKRIIGTLAAIVAATSLAITASAKEITFEASVYTITVGDITTVDGYESFTYKMLMPNGTTQIAEYFFPIGEEVEYCTTTYILPEGCTAADIPEYLIGYTADDLDAIDDVTYMVPGKSSVWGMDGTATEARNYLIIEGISASDMTDEEIAEAIKDALGELDDNNTVTDESAPNAGDTSDDTATGNASDDTATGDTANDTEAESDKASANTGIEGVAAIGGMLLIAGSAALLSRKKK